MHHQEENIEALYKNKYASQKEDPKLSCIVQPVQILCSKYLQICIHINGDLIKPVQPQSYNRVQ